MKYFNIISFLLLLIISDNSFAQQKNLENKSFCNPLNLDYRFESDEPSRREAADPTIIRYKNKYIMFASKTGGYWISNSLTDWDLVTNSQLPWEDYAPTAVAVNDTVYFMAYSANKNFSGIYRSKDPLKGEWQLIKERFPYPVWDPDLFLDDDGRLYLFYGLSNLTPIRGVELDRNTLEPISNTTDLFTSDFKNRGWERSGDYNTNKRAKPWVEGAWVTKIEEKYFLQYSVPGTQFKSYADGVYVADNPLGPYKLQEHNPFSYKPEGFVNGAGHGSTFQDKWGNYWYAGTMTISKKHQFERRIGFFPVFIDNDGVLYAYTSFGDFPHRMPQKKMGGPQDYQPEWMLLSYNKPTEVSSSLEQYPKEDVVNEDIRTYWSARTGEKGEWLMLDLLNQVDINAIQINFAEQDCRILGRADNIFHQYIVQYSSDKRNWKTFIDKSENSKDNPHDFIELSNEITARYIKIINYKVPDGKFAISGFRIFGKGKGKKPKAITSLKVAGNSEDACQVKLNWSKNADAVGYNIRYGAHPDKLYHNYQVFDKDSLNINSLNNQQKYYFTIDAFNENGITEGVIVIEG